HTRFSRDWSSDVCSSDLPGVETARDDPRLMQWIRAAARARRVASVCTGAFLLAAAGVLDGKRVTTHWAFTAQLAREFPRVSVERSEERRVGTESRFRLSL